MRELGYRLVDPVVTDLAGLREQSVGPTASRAELDSRSCYSGNSRKLYDDFRKGFFDVSFSGRTSVPAFKGSRADNKRSG